MQLEEQLQIPNTLALPAHAALGCQAFNPVDVAEAQTYARQHKLNFVPLGEGSNIVPHARVRSFVCLLRTRGIEVLDDTADQIQVRAAAGENWHRFVMYCLQQGWFGLENLALIPGSVGAAPVQNIGAYGVEVAQFIETVEVLDEQGDEQVLNAADCRFSYRDSLFKQTSGQTILSVTLRLNKQDAPVIEYPELKARLHHQAEITAAQLADAVIAIRRSKLPAPEAHPNVGSFFKNPIVPKALADELRANMPDLQQFPLPEQGGSGREQVKLSAAQLIDRAGWKDKPAQRVACWRTQPLVLVNTGGASDAEVFAFAAAIAGDIESRYGIQLELEPSVLS